jgi:hypothetical protein
MKKTNAQRCCFLFLADYTTPGTLLNTSLSLDVLDILLRDKQQNNDCRTKMTERIVNSTSHVEKASPSFSVTNTDDDDDDDNDDDNDEQNNVLPLPLWDRIRQRTGV